MATSTMLTSISFEDDGQITVTNRKLSDPSDKCHGDLAGLHEALTAAGAVLAEDSDLVPDEVENASCGRPSEAAADPAVVTRTRQTRRARTATVQVRNNE